MFWFSWCIENDNNFDRNEDLATGFLIGTDFSTQSCATPHRGQQRYLPQWSESQTEVSFGILLHCGLNLRQLKSSWAFAYIPVLFQERNIRQKCNKISISLNISIIFFCNSQSVKNWKRRQSVMKSQKYKIQFLL